MTDNSSYTLFRIGDLVHIEWTAVVFVFIVFSVTVYLMNKLLFRPVLDYTKHYDDEISSGNKEAEHILEQVDEKMALFDKKKADQLETLRKQRDDAMKEARAVAFDIINESRSEAKRVSSKNEELLDRDVKALKNSVDSPSDGPLSGLKSELKSIILSKIIPAK